MANPISLPLQEKIPCRNIVHRTLSLIILFLLLSLNFYRLLSLNNHGVTWFLAFLCESWFTFTWVLIMNAKWNPVDYKTYPDRLLKRFSDLPPVDLFVTTADSVLEPPIITINTVLSLLALDYPSHKLACYVSDDAASPLTFYSLVEASKFAKLWVPFCKKYNIQVRAPFMYFPSEPEASNDFSSKFQQDWRKMKIEYEQLSQRIEDASQKSVPCDLVGEFAAFSNIERRNHPSIVKVIWENKEKLADGLPHLVYVSREKQPKHPHHYKAGAMNVLTRVSGVMTNSPFMLNVDCDMFANNPQIVLHAMCLLLGLEKETEFAFVQSPQVFYGGLRDDPFGNQLVVLQQFAGQGIGRSQGPIYAASGCFHTRKLMYGLSPDQDEIKGQYPSSFNGESPLEALQTIFGNSSEFVKSTAKILSRRKESLDFPLNISSSLDVANQVAGSSYENNTHWGTKVGWVYGSTTEDIITSIGIHARGWKSAYCKPSPPAFLGCSPSNGPTSLTQQKRWATGLLEVLFTDNNPFLHISANKLQLRQCLGYLYLNLWGPRSLPELCYAILPVYCIFTNTYFLPSVSQASFYLPIALLIIYNIYTLSEYLNCGLSIRAWWNNQRMLRIVSSTAWLFGVLGVVLKLLGLSETIFEVTQKEQSTLDDGNEVDTGRITFDNSQIFVPGTTLLFLHLTALVVSLSRMQPLIHGDSVSGLGETICCAWMVLSFMPFVKGLFAKGKYGIPWSTIWKSTALALLFMRFCG